ncbi:MAG: hypothetical protein KDA77_18915, partial [Planctomycetaceae bacterium]|nr:hypothetical protein [Planctomycetaceae bacterium]
ILGLEAESLLLGGSRSGTASTSLLNVIASNVLVDDEVSLSLPELILAANDSVVVGDNVTLNATTDSNSSGGKDIQLNVSGDGAVVGLSSQNNLTVNRSGSTGTTGLIEIGNNTSLNADESIVLDTSHDAKLGDTVGLNTKELALSSERINLGDVPANAPGFTLSQEQLNSLGTSQTIDILRIVGSESIDIYSALDVEANNLVIQTNTLKTASEFDGDVVFAATDTVSIKGTSENAEFQTTAVTSSDNRALRFTGDKVNLENKTLTSTGFTSVNIEANRELVFNQNGGINSDSSIHVDAPIITAASGSDGNLKSATHISIASFQNLAADYSLPQSIGAKLVLSALGDIINAGYIRLPSGVFEVNAIGDSSSVHFLSESVVDLAGAKNTIIDVEQPLHGGRLAINATGDASLDGRVDVSGSTQGGDAGSITVDLLDGDYSGNGNLVADVASDSYRGGSFSVRTNSLEDFSTLNTQLNERNFTGARRVEIRNGDLNVGAGEEVNANTIDLVADSGSINVGGKLNTLGASGG